jgi:hypothetical protein
MLNKKGTIMITKNTFLSFTIFSIFAGAAFTPVEAMEKLPEFTQEQSNDNDIFYDAEEPIDLSINASSSLNSSNSTRPYPFSLPKEILKYITDFNIDDLIARIPQELDFGNSTHRAVVREILRLKNTHPYFRDRIAPLCLRNVKSIKIRDDINIYGKKPFIASEEKSFAALLGFLRLFKQNQDGSYKMSLNSICIDFTHEDSDYHITDDQLTKLLSTIGDKITHLNILENYKLKNFTISNLHKLVELKFKSCPNLQQLTISSLPALTTLSIESCFYHPYTTVGTLTLENLPILKTLLILKRNPEIFNLDNLTTPASAPERRLFFKQKYPGITFTCVD